MSFEASPLHTEQSNAIEAVYELFQDREVVDNHESGTEIRQEIAGLKLGVESINDFETAVRIIKQSGHDIAAARKDRLVIANSVPGPGADNNLSKGSFKLAA